MLKKTMYLSLLLNIAIESNDLDSIEKKEYNYRVEIDYIKEKTIIRDGYVEDNNLITYVEEQIFKQINRLEKEKDIRINLLDWEFQLDLDNIVNADSMSFREKEDLLKEEDITLNIRTKDNRTIYLNDQVKNILEERESFLKKN